MRLSNTKLGFGEFLILSIPDFGGWAVFVGVSVRLGANLWQLTWYAITSVRSFAKLFRLRLRILTSQQNIDNQLVQTTLTTTITTQKVSTFHKTINNYLATKIFYATKSAPSQSWPPRSRTQRSTVSCLHQPTSHHNIQNGCWGPNFQARPCRRWRNRKGPSP